jgi:uncharacterized protein YlzI (FlbEa/FlbD family)
MEINRARNMVELTSDAGGGKILINSQLIEAIWESNHGDTTTIKLAAGGGEYVVREKYDDVVKSIRKSKEFSTF